MSYDFFMSQAPWAGFVHTEEEASGIFHISTSSGLAALSKQGWQIHRAEHPRPTADSACTDELIAQILLGHSKEARGKIKTNGDGAEPWL